MKIKALRMIAIITLTATLCFSTSCDFSPPHQHTDTYTQMENVSEPTCKFKGYYDLVKYCKSCNEMVNKETVFLPKMAHAVENNVCKDCNQVASIGLEYKLNEEGNAYTLIGIGSCTDSQVIIPTHYKELPITAIAKDSFKGNTTVTAISCQKEITEIENYAFSECINLSSCYLDASEIHLEDYIFSGCPKIDNITLSDKLECYYADFDNQNILRKVNFLGTADQWSQLFFGRPLGSIPGDIHIQGELLTDLVLSEGITEISDLAFKGLKSLKTVTLPNSLNRVFTSAFLDCPNLEFTEYNNALYLGNSTNEHLLLVKAKDKKITSCDIHPSTKIIGSFAFNGCSELTSIEFPQGLLFIGLDSFNACKNITEVTIPESVLYIDNYAFSYSGIKKFTYLPSSCTNAFSILSGVDGGGEGIEVIIGNKVQTIPNAMFSHSGGSSRTATIKSITFEKNSSCTKIEYAAFHECPTAFDIYYFDSEEKWNSIEIEKLNEILHSSTVHFK